MPLNFHGHILSGDGKKLMRAVNRNPRATPGFLHWTETILGKVKIHPQLANWCYYRLQLCRQNHSSSAESVVLRTALRGLVTAIYSNWEIVISHLPVKTVDAAIKEFEAMCEISKEYPVMVWEYYDEGSSSDWVANTLAKLPSIESINHFYELPHMRMKYVHIQNRDYCGSAYEQAEAACKKALEDRDRRLMRVAKKKSRSSK
jgi:hypothetical protein